MQTPQLPFRIAIDVEKYDFAGYVGRWLGHAPLATIHERARIARLNEPGADQRTWAHRRVYAGMDAEPGFKRLYDELIRDRILPLFPGRYVFQRYPTFRLHPPGNTAVYAYHRDRDLGHHPREINFYLPLTEARSTATIWAETAEGAGDFQPIEAGYGEVVCFDGANLMHGNELNRTGRSRLSFDFRILSTTHHHPATAGASSTRGLRFVVGEYFDAA